MWKYFTGSCLFALRVAFVCGKQTKLGISCIFRDKGEKERRTVCRNYKPIKYTRLDSLHTSRNSCYMHALLQTLSFCFCKILHSIHFDLTHFFRRTGHMGLLIEGLVNQLFCSSAKLANSLRWYQQKFKLLIFHCVMQKLLGRARLFKARLVLILG